MRVTSDCPLIDPEICNQVLSLREAETADYAANNLPPSFPHGLDCEAMTAKALFEAESLAIEPHDREHVTPWLRRAGTLKRANLSAPSPGLAVHRWTLDYPEDLEFFRAVFGALPLGSRGNMADVLQILNANPSLINVNAMHRQRHVAQPAGASE
jgi:glutamate-1-semialdehyde 2,1-aminomutase/spore coat polysaccharide biosynthesis protein SpsF